MNSRVWIVVLSLLAIFSRTTPSVAQDKPPDDSELGTVEVVGSAGSGHAPPPKLGVIPLITRSNADSIVQLVTKGDLDLSGEYEVVDDSVAPPGPWTLDTPIDWKPWTDKKVEVLVRVHATLKGGAPATLVGEVFLAPPTRAATTPTDAGADVAPPPPPKAVFTTSVEVKGGDARAASHRLVDALLGGLTGRPGGFASQMAYSGRVGKWRQVFVVDSDGFNLHPYGPSTDTALSPVFGPGGTIFYSLSKNFHHYAIVEGPDATPVPMSVTGSILGLSFSPDRKSMAYAAFDDSDGIVFASSPLGSAPRKISSAPLASHPAYGPLGKIAYVAGRGAQRVYVDGKAVSPPGFFASSPSFCDTEKGLLVVFNVGYGMWADVVSVEADGGAVKRLTQGMGANSSAACSPDGRLVAFFSNHGLPGKGPGLYIVPLARPWLVKKVSSETGEWLKWDPITPK
jgi:TolB protein